MEELLEKLEMYKVKRYEWLEYGVRIIFNEYFFPYSINRIKNVLMDFTEYFSAKYSNQKLHCQKCNNSNDLETYCIDNITLVICEDCSKLIETEIYNINMENIHKPTNYLSGFIGSLLFSTPGIILTVLFFVFFNRLAAASSVLYVFLGIKGYKKFKGKVSKFGVFVIIMSTIIMVCFGIVVSYSILILKELKTLDIDMVIQILKMPEVKRELLMNIVLAYVISGFYLIFQIFQMIKEWKTEKVIKRPDDF